MTGPATAAVVVIGDALIDEIVTPEGSSEHVGGAALNVAVGLAILGVPVALVAMVGEDADGQRIREYLGERGVQLLPCPAPHGSARASSHRTGGEPTYTFNIAAQNRRISFTPEAAAALDAAELVVVSCFPFDDAEQSAELRSAVGRPDERLVVDVNPRAGMLRDRDVFVREFEATAATSRLVKIGDEDAALLYASPPAAVADRLLASGTRTVFTTLGAGGAELRFPSGEFIARPIADLPGSIVDTLGAGDASLATMAASLLRMPAEPSLQQWAEAVDLAMRYAAATCRSIGGTLRLA